MSDLNALAQKLNALAAKDDQFDDGTRVISRGGSPAPLTAMLGVIDETVLERRLDFTTGDSVVSVIAAGRRLRGVIAIMPSTNDAGQLAGVTLSRHEPEALDSAFAVLSTALDAADRLTVRSLPPEPFGSGGERGIAAVDLAAMWQIEMNEAPLPPMTKFLQENEAAFQAILHVNGGTVVTSQGDVASLQDIWDTQVAAFLQKQQGLSSSQDGPQLVCLDDALEGGRAVAVAIADEDVALTVYDPAHLVALHASWRTHFN